MEGEIHNYMKAWVQVILSLCYCYAIGKVAPKGIPTLLALLPITCLFLALPLSLHTLHLTSTFAFFISWLANFKLLLFAFHKGPLSHPSLSLPRFLAFACLPISPQHPPNKSTHNSQNALPTHCNYKSLRLTCTIKAMLFAGVIRAYDYSHFMHLNLLLSLYCIHIYLILEAILGMVTSLARALVGIKLEPPFDQPYLSTSLQDFWGRRWNVVVTKILRPTVYDPVLHVAQPRLGRKWALLSAVVATFLVSGLMHELIFFYLGRVKPTWEVTWFFLLHGFCLVVEIGLKKKLTARFRLPRVVSGLMTVGFVMVTAFWLFFPQLLRCKSQQRAFQEYAAVGAFVKNVVGAFNASESSSLQHCPGTPNS